MPALPEGPETFHLFAGVVPTLYPDLQVTFATGPEPSKGADDPYPQSTPKVCRASSSGCRQRGEAMFHLLVGQTGGV